MSRFLSEKYRNLAPYTPGEQPRERKYIKLNTNESPYPPSAGVLAAVSAEAEKLALYCDPECTALRTALADRYDTTADRVFVSNGSDESLYFAFLAFGSGGVAYPETSYGFYPVFADLCGIAAREIPLCDDFSIRKEDYFGARAMVVIANPNAPTGRALSRTEVEAIVRANPDNVVLIDEAYVDFGAESCLSMTEQYDNLLVVGTFSKSRSMAGARLGFAVGARPLIEDLERIKYATNPYNVNRMTQAAGTAALAEDAYYMENCKRIIETREYVSEELARMGFTVIPSKANFVFAKCPDIGGEDLYRAWRERGILVRHFKKANISDFNRITIGTRADMETLLSATADILKETRNSKQ